MRVVSWERGAGKTRKAIEWLLAGQYQSESARYSWTRRVIVADHQRRMVALDHLHRMLDRPRHQHEDDLLRVLHNCVVEVDRFLTRTRGLDIDVEIVIDDLDEVLRVIFARPVDYGFITEEDPPERGRPEPRPIDRRLYEQLNTASMLRSLETGTPVMFLPTPPHLIEETDEPR